MSVVTVRPTGTVAPDSSSVTGAADAHTATSDNSDASYVSKARYAPAVRLEMGNPTKPADSMTKTIQARVRRSSQSSGLTKLNYWCVRSGSGELGRSQTTAAGTSAADASGITFTDGDLSQALLDTFQVHCQVDASSAADARVYELYLDVTFAEQPTTAVTTSVSGDVVSVVWVHTAGADGGPQRWYRALLTDAAGGVVYDSGVADAPSTTTLAYGGLPEGTYTWSVQTAQDVNGVAHWAAVTTDSETVAAGTRSQVATLVATPDPLQAVVEVEVTIDPATDTADSVVVERLLIDGATQSFNIEAGTAGVATGWAPVDFGTISGTSQSIEAGGESGNFQRFTATAGVFAYRNWVTETSLPVTDGGTVAADVRIKSSGATGTAVPRFTIAFIEAENATDADWNSAMQYVNVYPANTASWKSAQVAAAVPDGARSALMGVVIEGGASGGALTVDFDLADQWVSSEGWVETRTPATITGDSALVFDFEAPPSVPLIYRARALNAGGATGQWVYADPVEWEAEDAVWFKPLGRPDLTMQLCLAERPTLNRPRQSVVIPILGSRHRVVRSDVLKSTEWDLLVETETAADAAAFLALCESGAELLLQFPTEYDMLGPHMWVSVLDVTEAFQSPVLGVYYRVWQLRVVEIGTP